MTAAERWTSALAEWAIPAPILATAPESPWGFRPEVFAHRADSAHDVVTPSATAAVAALPRGGSALDVGCGAGAAAMPLLDGALHVTGVDPSAEMLEEFALRMRRESVAYTSIEGLWPDVAGRAPVADVAVCHHVVYNVSELREFLVALTAHARRRVVLELTARHPLIWLNELWMTFHGLPRPTGPKADDVIAVLAEEGISAERADWLPAPDVPWASFATRERLVAMVRRRLCLPAMRDPDIDAALPAGVSLPQQELVALWWEGRGR